MKKHRLISAVFFVLLVLIGPGRVSSQTDAPQLSVSIRPAGVQGQMRYGHWAPLPVRIRTKTDTPDAVQVTLQVRGAGGYRTEQPLVLSSEASARTVRVPVYCSSGFPVFTVRVLSENGDELAREQKRFRRVVPGGRRWVGLSESLSSAARDRIRSSRSADDPEVTFQTASRKTLLEAGRWPGLMDTILLKTEPEMADEVLQSKVRVYDPDRTVEQGGRPVVRTAPVDRRAYNLFERPSVSKRRRAWYARSVWLQLLMLAGFLFLCFWLRSAWSVWGGILLLPIGLSLVLLWSAPQRPEVVRQVVSAHFYRQDAAPSLVDQRVSLFPFEQHHDKTREEGGDGTKENGSTDGTNAERAVSYPVRRYRRTVPVFFRESALNDRFPLLKKKQDTRVFSWSSFPVDGYFVFQHFRVTSDSNAPVRVTGRGKDVEIQNRSDRWLENLWVHRNGQYLDVGSLAPGSSVSLIRKTKNDVPAYSSRENLLKNLFDVQSRQDRILKRWTKYVLDRYPTGGMYVVGQRSGNVLQGVPGSSYEDEVLPELFLFRVNSE